MCHLRLEISTTFTIQHNKFIIKILSQVFSVKLSYMLNFVLVIFDYNSGRFFFQLEFHRQKQFYDMHFKCYFLVNIYLKLYGIRFCTGENWLVRVFYMKLNLILKMFFKLKHGSKHKRRKGWCIKLLKVVLLPVGQNYLK